uniref:Uncharacterized protein n=1 Tax=Romanomermis culicivorax TaxID=13658 RepID=A0A915K2T6_ROMCU
MNTKLILLYIYYFFTPLSINGHSSCKQDFETDPKHLANIEHFVDKFLAQTGFNDDASLHLDFLLNDWTLKVSTKAKCASAAHKEVLPFACPVSPAFRQHIEQSLKQGCTIYVEDELMWVGKHTRFVHSRFGYYAYKAGESKTEKYLALHACANYETKTLFCNITGIFACEGRFPPPEAGACPWPRSPVIETFAELKMWLKTMTIKNSRSYLNEEGLKSIYAAIRNTAGAKKHPLAPMCNASTPKKLKIDDYTVDTRYCVADRRDRHTTPGPFRPELTTLDPEPAQKSSGAILGMAIGSACFVLIIGLIFCLTVSYNRLEKSQLLRKKWRRRKSARRSAGTRTTKSATNSTAAKSKSASIKSIRDECKKKSYDGPKSASLPRSKSLRKSRSLEKWHEMKKFPPFVGKSTKFEKSRLAGKSQGSDKSQKSQPSRASDRFFLCFEKQSFSAPSRLLGWSKNFFDAFLGRGNRCSDAIFGVVKGVRFMTNMNYDVRRKIMVDYNDSEETYLCSKRISLTANWHIRHLIYGSSSTYYFKLNSATRYSRLRATVSHPVQSASRCGRPDGTIGPPLHNL